MAYFPADGGHIALALGGSYIVPAGDAVRLSNIPEIRTLTPDTAIPWGEFDRVNRLLGAGWNQRRFVARSFSVSHQNRAAVERALSTGWRQREGQGRCHRSAWENLASRHERVARSTWLSTGTRDQLSRIAWDGSRRRPDQMVVVGYGHPPPMERRYDFFYGDQAINDIVSRYPFKVWLPIKDISHRTMWGPKFYAEICWRHYLPPAGDGVVQNIHLPITHVGDKDNIQFFFDQYTYDRRCSWREPSGWRDNYYYIPPGKVPAGRVARVYVMHHSACLTRLPERTAIDVASMTLSTDWDSVYWSLKANLGSDAHLALLEPTPDGPIAVEAAMNGHIWKMQVDRTGSGRAFGGNSRTIEGRSISAQLGAPAAQIRTYTETMERSAAQLMTQELENTGWTLVIGIDDWLVPANTFSYQDQTPIGAIKTIADAVGGMVQSHMRDQVLLIKKKYAVPPWLWSTATPDLEIPYSMIDKLDTEWDERTFFNAAFVSGGISAKVFRNGSAADKAAPMVQDPLITAVEAARQRGIAILAASGKWSKHRMELPVFAEPVVPSVILPGTLIRFVDGILSWIGVVTAVSVTANRARSGLKIRQTIDVERYRGN
ncbi:MAG: hypothetical protein F9K32_16525 [Desulfobulbaceae bacterium]|nr:MAG: hypothetical protein F9K32_16525 [Desulfobulbaceae bacterium]